MKKLEFEEQMRGANLHYVLHNAVYLFCGGFSAPGR